MKTPLARVALAALGIAALAAPAIAQQRWSEEATGATTSTIQGEWEIQAVAGYPAFRKAPMTVRFENDQVSGTTGCNSFSGSYTAMGARLAVSPLAMTKRACTDRRASSQEKRLLALLAEQLTVNAGRKGLVALAARNGDYLVLAPAKAD